MKLPASWVWSTWPRSSLDAWAQELGPVGTMLAQEVLELDYGSRVTFGRLDPGHWAMALVV